MLQQPVVTGNPGVMLVDPPVAITPLVELTAGNVDMLDENDYGYLRFLRPFAYKIDNLIANIAWYPSAL
jgi:hypothetical protein